MAAAHKFCLDAGKVRWVMLVDVDQGRGSFIENPISNLTQSQYVKWNGDGWAEWHRKDK